ncbi:MAG: DUF433 domain-containing protein [Planctomycetes bacterium]|nr:DUF433 domain-containing protein [Planctomycetota bacterium]
MNHRITVDPQIHFGKPCIVNTRIPVQAVLELICHGLSFGEIIKNYYPDIQMEDIEACLQYAIDLIASEDVHISPEVA